MGGWGLGERGVSCLGGWIQWTTEGTRQNGWRVRGGPQKSAHRRGEWNVAKREREQRGDLDSVKGECEVKDIWQGCITGADGEEMEAVEAREGRRGASASLV